MSTSLWIIIAVITIISIIIFKKTVSSDAENDFKIRDILSGNSYEEEPEPTPQQIKTQKNIETDYLNPQKNIYEEIEELEHKQSTQQAQEYSQPKQEYSTQTHNEQEFHTETQNNYEYSAQNSYKQPQSKTMFEKEFQNIEKEYKVKKKGFTDYVKMFWKGITFSIGALITLYSFYGLTHFVQTSNDAILYSIWLLVGVILIK